MILTLTDDLEGFKTAVEKVMDQLGLPGGSVVKNPPTNAEDTIDMGSILGWGRSLGGGHGNPL